MFLFGGFKTKFSVGAWGLRWALCRGCFSIQPLWHLEDLPVLAWAGLLPEDPEHARFHVKVLGTGKLCFRENLPTLPFFLQPTLIFQELSRVTGEWPGQNILCGFHLWSRWLGWPRERWPGEGFPQPLENCKTERARNVSDQSAETFDVSWVTLAQLYVTFQLVDSTFPLILTRRRPQNKGWIFPLFPRCVYFVH